MEKEIINLVRQSYGRCIANKMFISKFYDRFLASNSEIKKKFENTDFSRQQKLLSNGINMLIMYVSGNQVATNVINRLQVSHNAANLDIQPKLYTFWKKSLLETIDECDPKASSEVIAAWNKTLDAGIQAIISGYSVSKTA